ncbi:kinase-like protein [Thelephora terrestris]|uniref:Kinase-like protein n=1 Tax=Thelephora terrestris TaxID=56493 RepID=A0A9P6HF53_9AGAM|nr:kinase-like protein [Thelephora terrestris]
MVSGIFKSADRFATTTWRQPSSSEISSPPSELCAKFLTTNKDGEREALLLTLDKPVIIGRNPAHGYVIPDLVVSSIHCKLYAVQVHPGGFVISCQDLSTNGTLLNGHRIRKASVILVDGDTIEIPSSQKFQCLFSFKTPREKAHIFEPTPPIETAHKGETIGKYTVTSHCLGSGSFATVHLAFDRVNHRQVACKTIKTKKGHEVDKVYKEVGILTGLNHPNINRVFDLEQDGAFLHIFLQLCTGGDLFSYIISHVKTSYRLCESEAKYIMFQILTGVKYLHDKKISHRDLDLKPENILLCNPGPYPHIQIADFGLARPKAYQKTMNVCGTVSYLPPEGILAMDNHRLGYVGMPSDCWSAGVMLYIMLAGYHPFDFSRGSSCKSWWPSAEWESASASEKGEGVVKKRIIDGHVDFRDRIWTEEVSQEARELVTMLLVYDYLERATVYGALRSLWIVRDEDALRDAYRKRISTEPF